MERRSSPEFGRYFTLLILGMFILGVIFTGFSVAKREPLVAACWGEPILRLEENGSIRRLKNEERTIFCDADKMTQSLIR